MPATTAAGVAFDMMHCVKQITIRRVDPALSDALEGECRRRRKSLNQTILELLHQSLGLAIDGAFRNGLGRHAGGWSQDELEAFERNAAPFERVDAEDWQ